LKPTSRLAPALLLALPLAGHALNICTDAAGKPTFQDKPCETRDAAPQYTPLKAASVTEAGALETMKRLTGAMGARDVVAMQRLMAANFESRVFMSRDKKDPGVINRAQVADLFTRVLQAAKAYHLQRSCSRDTAHQAAGEIALNCNYTGRIEVLSHASGSGGVEFARVGVENGELKVLEVSDPKAIEALNAKASAQAAR